MVPYRLEDNYVLTPMDPLKKKKKRIIKDKFQILLFFPPVPNGSVS
jgi:hypothetical protein